ncbi:MAG: hypothetical protein KGV51_00005 [Moraxellaceae bacterium]|nr:hypothetical protein [Moraxellaceae bacterium]
MNDPVQLRALKFSHIGKLGTDLKQWKVNLSLASTEQQYTEIELVLGEILIADIDDDKRMKIMLDMQSIIQRLISDLHSEYIHEPSGLSAKQGAFVDKVKSIYFLCALIYDGIYNRQIEIKQQPYKKPKKISFQSLLSLGQSFNNLIQRAIYHLMQYYVYILMEYALTFEKTPDPIWQQLNFSYLYAVQENIAKTKIRNKDNIHNVDTINEYYLQACMYSLFRPASFRRQDILSLHKVLGNWAKKVTLEADVNSDSKIFIDLNSSSPPEYLTPYSKVNPYDENNICLFIHIDKLLAYLDEIQHANNINNTPSFEIRLAKLAEYTLKQQQFKLRSETRHPTREEVVAVIGLHRIHYHLSGKQPFGKLINKSELPNSYHPKLHSSLDMTDYEQTTPIILLDKSTSGYRFNSTDKKAFDIKDGRTPPIAHSYTYQSGALLKVLSLFAIMPNPLEPNSTWQLGMIRWLDHQDNCIQAGSKLIGYSVTACGVRLEDRDERTRDFVPALLVAGNETLETKTSLILPNYHFREDDKVVLRIGNKETKLRLLENIQNTDDIQQYEIVRLTNGK